MTHNLCLFLFQLKQAQDTISSLIKERDEFKNKFERLRGMVLKQNQITPKDGAKSTDQAKNSEFYN